MTPAGKRLRDMHCPNRSSWGSEKWEKRSHRRRRYGILKVGPIVADSGPLPQPAFRRRFAAGGAGPVGALGVAHGRPESGRVEKPLGEERLSLAEVGAQLGLQGSLDLVEPSPGAGQIPLPEGEPGAVESERLGE